MKCPQLMSKTHGYYIKFLDLNNTSSNRSSSANIAK